MLRISVFVMIILAVNIMTAYLGQRGPRVFYIAVVIGNINSIIHTLLHVYSVYHMLMKSPQNSKLFPCTKTHTRIVFHVDMFT